VSNLFFGRGDLLCRVDNKTRLMRKRGETWQREIWRGYEPEHPVWRIEFQFRRAALRDFHVDGEHVHSMADALAVRRGLWRYGVELLSLRDPVEDSNRAAPAAERHLRNKGCSFEQVAAHRRERLLTSATLLAP
jgi:hypothetical protein